MFGKSIIFLKSVKNGYTTQIIKRHSLSCGLVETEKKNRNEEKYEFSRTTRENFTTLPS